VLPFPADRVWTDTVGCVVPFDPGAGGALEGDDGAQRAESVRGALAVYPGLAPFSKSGLGGNTCCACRGPRFDVDRYGRPALPNAVPCSVRLHDNAGNLIAEFGRYGNFDSRFVNPATAEGRQGRPTAAGEARPRSRRRARRRRALTRAAGTAYPSLLGTLPVKAKPVAAAKNLVEQRVRRFAETCRRRGLRVTHQRMEIFRELAGTDEHPDAETIYRRVHRRIPAVSRDTVYRTLGLLEAQGLARKAEVQAGAARYDANTDGHHHYVCTRCGLVRDVYCQAMDRVRIPASVRAIGTVTSRHVHLRGRCRRCAARRARRP